LQIGNSPVVDGKAAFAQSLEEFVGSVAGFGHTITGVWSDRHALIAELEVHYAMRSCRGRWAGITMIR
jgi:hypothetical protein